MTWSKGARVSRSAIHARCANGHTPELNSLSAPAAPSERSTAAQRVGGMTDP